MFDRGLGARSLIGITAVAAAVITVGGGLALASGFGAAATSGKFKLYKAGGEVGGITKGPDGALWFTEDTDGVGSISTAGHKRGPFHDGPSTDNNTVSGEPEGITRGPDGALWVAGMYYIDRFDTRGHVRRIFLGPNSVADSITTGPDGALWFTASPATPGSGASIDRMTTAGTITNNFPLASSAEPEGIVTGPGGLWFTEYAGNAIGRITTAGKITTFPLRTKSANPTAIVVGPDGNLWFTEARGKIGRITPTGKITEFKLPVSNSDPQGITSGPQHALWFGEAETGKIGRITTAGKITEYPIPGATPGAGAVGITVGPDHNLWFTVAGLSQDEVGRYTP